MFQELYSKVNIYPDILRLIFIFLKKLIQKEVLFVTVIYFSFDIDIRSARTKLNKCNKVSVQTVIKVSAFEAISIEINDLAHNPSSVSFINIVTKKKNL